MNILLISLLGCLVVALPSASAQKVKWCVTQKELEKCKHFTSKSADIECLLQPSITDCIKSIERGEADAVAVDGEHVYFGGLKPYGLRPIIAEKYKTEPCYAVAVVKRSTGFSIRDLKGKTSCHGCYQLSGGWTLPIGQLVKHRIIDWDCPDYIPLEKAVSQFFSRSCIPGISKAEYPNLCSACQGDCSCLKCFIMPCEIAFQCMKRGDGDVAFICQSAIPVSERQDYELLCTDGTRKDVDQYKDCHLGKKPARAVIARKDDDSQHIYKALTQVPDSDLFSSSAFGGKDLIFSDSATGLVELPKITDSFLYLKHDYYETMRALKAGTPPAPALDRKIQWCTISHAEQQKCDSLQIPRIECRSAHSVEECIQKVMRREADAFATDGGHVYIAGKCGLVPVMAEEYNAACADGGEASSYHVVAVVRKDSGVTWSSLRGRKSCHTGLNRNAGWKVPDSVICGNTPDCLYKFFSQGCAPGADPASNMCELCKGSGKPVGDEGKCKASSEEMYYGFDGAFRCLAEKAGEVAFIKHTIVGDYTDGKGPDWAKQLNLKADEFELICPQSPDKTFKYSEFADCKLATVPAHAVVTREDARGDVVSILKEAQTSSKSLFKSEGERNLLFSDSTKCLQTITKSPEEFLTKPYIDMIEKTFATGQSVPDLVKICTLDSLLSS